MSQMDAWRDSSILIVKGIVTQVRYDDRRAAYYTIDISELLKPIEKTFPSNITVVDPYYMSTAMIELKTGENVVLFLRKGTNQYYESTNEINLDTPIGAKKLLGLRLFLDLMYTSDKSKQSQKCMNAWNNNLSDQEKAAVLDAMWETRCPYYVDSLVNIAKGQNSAEVRSWAITILAYIEEDDYVEDLIPLLDDPDWQVKRQLLLLFGAHKVKKAQPRIEKLLTEDIKALFPWQADNVREMAQEALDKITGKNTSPYWKN